MELVNEAQFGGRVEQGCKYYDEMSPAQLSPVLINHVLEKIFDGASISELIGYRQVCRVWNDAATKTLQTRLDFVAIGCRNTDHVHSIHYKKPSGSSSLPQQRFHVADVFTPFSYSSTTFTTSFPRRPDNLVSPAVNRELLESFLKVISSSTNPPFTKFEVVPGFFIRENETILNRFFDVSSQFIHVLKISLDNHTPSEFPDQFLSHVAFDKLRFAIFEVIRRLTISDDNAQDPTSEHVELQDNPMSYKIFSRILAGATKLEQLEVSLQRKEDGDGRRRYNPDGTPDFDRDRREGFGRGGTCPCQYFSTLDEGTTKVLPGSSTDNSTSINDNVLTSTVTASSEPKCPPSLSVDADGKQRVMLFGISDNLNLKQFHIRLRNSFMHQSCITSLLQRLANTLEEFTLSEESHGSSAVIEFPKMKKLHKLTISAVCEFEQNYVTLFPINYREQFPWLATLDLWNCFGEEKRFEQLFLGGTTSQTLTNLVFPSQFRNVTLAQNVPRMFPNLKSLKIVFSTREDNLAMMATVFSCYGESLEELHFITDMNSQNENVDHVLTGLPKEICRRMRMDESFVLPLHLQGMERKPSLVNLTRLKRLIFQMEYKYSRAPLISDVTGYLAFMEMPNLEYLRFTKYGMSWTCCKALGKKCRIEVLDPLGYNVFGKETIDFNFDFAGM